MAIQISNAQQLKNILEHALPRLKEIEATEFAYKINASTWSKKEILGHLIDSATNNHQRFIHGQFENAPMISYDQNQWVEKSKYQEMDKEILINFWYSYNTHLIYVVQNIPDNTLQNKCTMRDGSLVTIEFLIGDYIAHLEHHLSQILNR